MKYKVLKDQRITLWLYSYSSCKRKKNDEEILIIKHNFTTGTKCYKV